MEGVTVGQVFDAECILSKRPRKGKCEYLVKWRGWSSKEQEKELLFQTKGKRPRGRPRKILPGPVKRPQILLAKPEPPVILKKKRGRKPLHPDVRALRQAKSRAPLPPPSSRTGPSKALKLGGHGGGAGSLSLRRPDAKQLIVSKAATTPRERANQALSLRALNLQSSVSKVASGSGQQGGARASLRSGAIVKGGGVKVGGLNVGGVVEQQLADSQTGSGSAERKLNELSTGDSDETSSDSETDDGAAMFPASIVPRPGLGGGGGAASDTETDWRPERSRMETVCVTDVTANFITVTVKESPTSEGFFSALKG
ncbi:Chromobox protein like 2 [Dissostichus eleginoides]|uniref:Chromobox protein like 2 n=1 Tax=Dissostichus eleginoides TaxID=100907 RepID=A0AAD9BE02_DISEL|nr:Chromobox protein like 2 [Dissostichus eleginoides]